MKRRGRYSRRARAAGGRVPPMELISAFKVQTMDNNGAGDRLIGSLPLFLGRFGRKRRLATSHPTCPFHDQVGTQSLLAGGPNARKSAEIEAGAVNPLGISAKLARCCLHRRGGEIPMNLCANRQLKYLRVFDRRVTKSDSPSDTALAKYGGRELQPNRGVPLKIGLGGRGARGNTAAVERRRAANMGPGGPHGKEGEGMAGVGIFWLLRRLA